MLYQSHWVNPYGLQLQFKESNLHSETLYWNVYSKAQLRPDYFAM